MADPGLLQALDYILNQCDDSSINVLAEAIVRRRRNLSIFNAIGNIPDPEKMAKEISTHLGGSTKNIMNGMKMSIREMIIRILHEHAPELNESQINELCEAWLPEQSGIPGSKTGKKSNLPSDAILSMIEHFVSFSSGTMRETVDKNLREELGAWPERYWNAFPPVIRQIIKDYLQGKITDREYRSKVIIALG
jgi:hypothetical protein